MLKLLIIADDLTGANDTGAQFAKKGIPVFVMTEAKNGAPALWNNYPVIVANTESRHVVPDEAARRVKKIVELGLDVGVTHFYKKTDSSLRGNIGSELEALMIATGRRLLPFIPAFPKLKRTTNGGFQYVGNKLLHETTFGQDSLEPIVESYIPSIIKQQTKIHTRVVKTSEMSLLDPAKYEQEMICVLDGATDKQLHQTGEFLKSKDLLKATAGSAGFAEHLPGLLGFERRLTEPPPVQGRMLVVSGSVNESSLKQTSYAEARGFVAITLSPELLAAKDGARSVEAQRVIARITELDRQQKEIILRSIEKPEDVKIYLDRGHQLKLDLREVHSLIAKNMGEITAQVLERTNFKLLIVFGGDTLMAIARALGWSGLLPQDEIMPGVVASRIMDGKGELLLITKAGGFGAEDVLLQVKDILGSKK